MPWKFQTRSPAFHPLKHITSRAHSPQTGGRFSPALWLTIVNTLFTQPPLFLISYNTYWALQAWEFAPHIATISPESCFFMEGGQSRTRSIPQNRRIQDQACDIEPGWFLLEKAWVSWVGHMRALVTISCYVTGSVVLWAEFPLKFVRQIDQCLFDSLIRWLLRGRVTKEGVSVSPIPYPWRTNSWASCHSFLLDP